MTSTRLSDTKQIADSLLNLFNSPERWAHEGRKLVFWYDPGGEFRDLFEHLELGVTKLELSGTPFHTKYHLLVEAPETDYLLYAPYAQPADVDNWLLDLELSGLSFSADRAAMIFRELGLFTRHLEGYIRDHSSFFNSKRRYGALLDMNLSPDTDTAGLRLAMMCAVAGLKIPDVGLLLRKLLMGGLDEAQNDLWAELTKQFSEAELWGVVEEAFAYRAAKPSLRQLFIRLAVTHMGRVLAQPLPPGLGDAVLARSAQAYVFVDTWLRHADDAAAWKPLSNHLVADLGIAELVQALNPNDYAEVETFESFDRAMLRALVLRLGGEGVDYADLRNLISRRKPLFWYEQYEAYYTALEAAADFYELLSVYADGFSGTASDLFNAYAKDLYRIDKAYRHYVFASDRASLTGDILKPLDDQIEAAYTRRYLDKLSQAWSNALEANSPSWGVPGVAAQWQFYARTVMPYLANHEREKVFVIISDALRYEVAAELPERLSVDLRGEAELSPMLSVLPSRTNFGMAALLPGDKLGVTERGVLTRSGLSTQGSDARQKVLDAANYDAVVLGSNELLELSREQGRERVKEARLIYIYHDTIDKTGEIDEREVFAACNRALDELETLIKRVVNSLNGTNLYLVSDHGFLYQRAALEAPDKIDVPSKADLFELKRRHALGSDPHAPAGSLGFDLPYLENDLKAYSPRGNERYAIQGAGAQYVHGGLSLQEVVVPLLYYKHVRSSGGDDKPSYKVGVQVIASSRRVTNTLFTLRLLQQEAVGGRVRPRTVRVALYDEAGKAVTNEALLELDKTSEQATEREQTVRLSVALSKPDRAANYYLVIKDSEDPKELLRETWRIDLAFSDDFGDL